MKEEIKPNLMIEMSKLMGTKPILNHRVFNSVKRVAKKAHVWQLEQQVFVLKEERRLFTGFQVFKGVERLRTANECAKKFVSSASSVEGVS